MRLCQPIWPRFLPSGLVIAVATLGPIGRMRKAPGTWGSLAGLVYFTLFFYQLGVCGTLFFSAVGIYVAVAFCGEAEFRLGKRDPGEIVLDEVIAIPLCFLGWPVLLGVAPPWVIFIAGFLLFRFSTCLSRWVSRGCNTCQAVGAWWPMMWRPRWRHARRCTGWGRWQGWGELYRQTET